MADTQKTTEAKTTEAKTRTRTPRGPLTGQMKGMLRPSEAAEFLGASESTLAAWRRNQTNVAFYKVGNVIGYKKEDLEACRREHFTLQKFEPTAE